MKVEATKARGKNFIYCVKYLMLEGTRVNFLENFGYFCQQGACRAHLALCARLPTGQRFLIGRALYLVFLGAPCLHPNKIHKTIYTSDLHGSEGVTLLPFTSFPFGFRRTSLYFPSSSSFAHSVPSLRLLLPLQRTIERPLPLRTPPAHYAPYNS